MRKPLAIAAAFFFLIAACTDDDTTSTTRTGFDTGISGVAAGFDPDSIRFAASLHRFDACTDVLAYFKAEAMARVGPYGLEGGGFIAFPAFEEDVAVAAVETDGGVDSGAPAPGGSREGVDFSGSNVQVVGVDEPDIIKTDGSRILTIVNGNLSYVDVSNGSARLLDSLFLPGWDHRFFMEGDRAIVFARGDGFAVPLPEVAAETDIAIPYGGPKTLVFEVDLSDPDELSVARTMHIDGNFLSARSIEGTVRIVVSAYPSDLPFVYPSNQAAEDFALEANKGVIADSTIDTWLPNYTLVTSTDGELIGSGLLVDCGGVHRPAEFAGFDTLSILTMDIGDGLSAPDGTAVVAQGETVYSSTESLYVATNVWIPNEVWGTDVVRRIEEEYSTAIHKFDISDGSTEYAASGAVDGHLLNQFAMDEYDGYLRMATTDGPPWGFDEKAESFVTVLQERDGALQKVSEVGGMGRGERIFSVRFIADAAYVVTFRQVDPFYVVDLSDPESPEIAGELKIAGYSGYLHPIGDDRVLGIGQDATDEGRTTGAKATMFDVSDPANPRELGTWTMEGSSTEVEWDHLAFLHWPPESIAVLPVQNWQTNFYGAVVLKTDDGVREFGRISHSPAAGVGVHESDCRELTIDEILALDASAEPEEGVTVHVCGEEEDVRAGSTHSCESMPYDEAIALSAEEGIDLTSVMDEGDRLVVCFPEFIDVGRESSPIMRSLVIGDQIWTLSWQSLQSNALDDLAVGQLIPLG